MDHKYVRYVAYNAPEAALLQEVEQFVSEMERNLGIASGVSIDHSLNSMPDMESLFIAWSNREIAGVATIFNSTADLGEIAICVRPTFTRHGIGSALLHLGLRTLQEHGVKRRVLICDRKSSSGTHFVLRHARGELFREYTMERSAQVALPEGSRLSIRDARTTDINEMTRICAAAYGDSPTEAGAFIETSMISVNRTGHVGLLDGRLIAICFISEHEEYRSVNTVAVDPPFQGRGHGTEFLAQVLRQLPQDGKPIRLDVDGKNLHAIAVYRRLGFLGIYEIGYHEV